MYSAQLVSGTPQSVLSSHCIRAVAVPDDDEDEDRDYSEPSLSMATSASFVDEDEFVVRLDRMSSELDTLVRFVRRGVESLAAGSGEAAVSFGMLAFTLEDWDQ